MKRFGRIPDRAGYEGDNMGKDIFDILAEISVDERMEDFLRQDEKYMELEKRVWDYTQQCDRIGLTADQKQVIDELISSHVEMSGAYGRKIYQQGFRDCAVFLGRMNLIRVP